MTHEQFKAEIEAIPNDDFLKIVEQSIRKLKDENDGVHSVFSQLIERFKFLEFRIAELSKERQNKNPF